MKNSLAVLITMCAILGEENFYTCTFDYAVKLQGKFNSEVVLCCNKHGFVPVQSANGYAEYRKTVEGVEVVVVLT